MLRQKDLLHTKTMQNINLLLTLKTKIANTVTMTGGIKQGFEFYNISIAKTVQSLAEKSLFTYV